MNEDSNRIKQKKPKTKPKPKKSSSNLIILPNKVLTNNQIQIEKNQANRNFKL